jgi:hypothetical protein
MGPLDVILAISGLICSGVALLGLILFLSVTLKLAMSYLKNGVVPLTSRQ